MARRARLRARHLAFPSLVMLVACSFPEARPRVAPPRGTVGEEVYGIFCDRIGAQTFTEDLDGSSFHALCHKDPGGKYADVVDESKLPPIAEGLTDPHGVPESIDEARARRQRHVGRMTALVRRRPDIIRALDAAFPDVVLSTIADVKNADPARSCEAVDAVKAGRDAKLTRQLADMLGRLQALYNDGTLPRVTEALGRLMIDLQQSDEGREALTRIGARVGYRPSNVQLGLVRPAVAYARLRDLSNASLSLLSADSQPYVVNPRRDEAGKRIPIPGPAHDAFAKLLETTHEELRTYTVDIESKALETKRDDVRGVNLVTRPRTKLEFVNSLAFREDPAFASLPGPLYVVRRDDRGVALPRALPNNVLPSPFTPDDRGRAKLDDLGRFVTADGKPPPSPFDVPFAPDLADLPVVTRDSFGRALAADSQPLYQYIDTNPTFANALLRDMRTLIKVDVREPKNSEDVTLDLIAGIYVLLGSRDAGNDTVKEYPPDPKASQRWKLTHPPEQPPAPNLDTDPVRVKYRGFHTEDSRLLDFLHAIANVLAYRGSDATLALVKKLGVEHENDVARLIGEALRIKAVSDKDPKATLPRTSVFWDDLLDVVVRISRQPGMLEEILKVLGDDVFLTNGVLFANYMKNRDLVSYDRDNLNGPIYNLTTNRAADEPKTPVDRNMPDAGANRSTLQRFVQLVHDTNGVTACNRENAVLYAVIPNVLLGQPAGVLFPADFQYAAGGAGTGGYKTCEFLKVDNLAKFYLESLSGKSKISIRQSDVVAGTAARAFLSPPNTDPATQKEGDYCGYDIAPASLVGNICLPTQKCCLFPNVVNFSQAATEQLFETVTGIKGFYTTDATFHPKPEFISRFAFFDFDKDNKNPVTKTALLRVNGKNIGTKACTEKVFRDPCAAGSGAPHQALCAGAPDIAPDGMIHGYYECANDAETLRGRDDNTLFLGEVFGFQQKIQPLLDVFVKRDQTQLFIDLMDVLHTHYQSAEGASASDTCAPVGAPQSNGKYCARSGIAKYEPILVDMFLGDLLGGLHDLEKTLEGITVKRCTELDATKGVCAKADDVPAIDLLADTTRDLVDPERAAKAGLKNRDNGVGAKRADGTAKPQVTSIDQIADSLRSFDDAFDAYAKAHPQDTNRQAQWRRARSRLVDLFFTVDGTGKAAKLKNRSTQALLPILLDTLQEQLDAQCPSSFAPPYLACEWAKTGLTKKLSESLTGPMFATTVDVLDAIRNDDRARTETQLLLLTLLDPDAPNDARAALLTSLVDILQLLRDEATVAKLLHGFAGVAEASVNDEKGRLVQTSLVDASTALLARLNGRAFDAQNREICAREIDPNQILTTSLQNLVKPFPADPAQPNRPTQTPLELLLDVIAEVNRTDPGLTTKMAPADYASVAKQLESFLLDKQRGLEQFYEVIRQGTQGQGDL